MADYRLVRVRGPQPAAEWSLSVDPVYQLGRTTPDEPVDIDLAPDGYVSRRHAAIHGPEQCDPSSVLDVRAVRAVRADIYAFGCVLFEMLSGEFAAVGETKQELRAAHQWVL